jgi:hypothetical protein
MSAKANLWLFALRMPNDATNEAPNLKDNQGRSPIQAAKFKQTPNPGFRLAALYMYWKMHFNQEKEYLISGSTDLELVFTSGGPHSMDGMWLWY